MRIISGLLGGAALAIGTLIATPATAQQIQTRTITIDENGHGTITGGESPITLSFAMLPDPGPGGLPSVLTYTLPSGFTVIPGDVLLTDADFNNLPLDVLRFNQVVGAVGLPGTISFYSDNVDGFDALADTASPPGAFYTNLVSIPEVGPEEGPNGALYTPTPNQPGFIPGFLVTYNFISDDGPVPEPATWALMIAGFGAAGVSLRRRRTRKTLATA